MMLDGCPVCGERIGGEHGTPAMAHDCQFPGCALGPGHAVGYHLVDGQRVTAAEDREPGSMYYDGGPQPPTPVATETDPREVALIAVRNMAFDWYCPNDERHPRVNCRECIAEVALDAYEAASRLDHGITS